MNSGTEFLNLTLEQGNLFTSPPILLELTSSPKLTENERQLFRSLPALELTSGVWERAGELRRKLLKFRLKARAMDCLIAQICIDTNVSLLTKDSDFRHFLRFGLKLSLANR